MTALFPPLVREIPYAAPCSVFEVVRMDRSFLLESVKGPGRIARYSFIGFDPYLEFLARDGGVEIVAGDRRTVSYRRPLERLRELVNCYRQQTMEGLPPFLGGAAGIFSYDFVRYLEEIPQKASDDLQVPDAHFFMIDRLIAFDHILRKAWVVVCPGARETVLGFTELESDIGGMTREADAVAEDISRKISEAIDRTESCARRGKGTGIQVRQDISRDDYVEMVKRAKEYIAAGDIFQANLSLRVSADVGGIDAWEVYKVLREINPSPFASFFDFGGYQIVSSSPERLVRVSGRIIDTRPIAGTRPRGRDVDEDAEMRAELLLNEKERAEHIMLIDLERNDIGRVADFGSVHVDELMVTEDYSHVIHIVSNVEGRLAEGKDCFDVIAAVYPGGTITGVPKVRCMEIIDELEPFRRGPYTGSLGYIGFNGCMDLNIIIRTFLIKDGRAYIQAGAGIVADSDPEREYNECNKKAEALLRTLERL